MNWKPELDELARREAFAREMGGADKVKRSTTRAGSQFGSASTSSLTKKPSTRSARLRASANTTKTANSSI
jgi:hypothetical protein